MISFDTVFIILFESGISGEFAMVLFLPLHSRASHADKHVNDVSTLTSHATSPSRGFASS